MSSDKVVSWMARWPPVPPTHAVELPKSQNQAQPPLVSLSSSVSSQWTLSKPISFIIHFQLGCNLWITPGSKPQKQGNLPL